MPLSFLLFSLGLGSGSWGRCISRSRLVSRCWVVRFGLRVDGSWGRCISRSRLVSRCWVVRFGLRVDGSSFVCDVSNITVIVISGVGNSLDTTIGKGN